MLRSESPGLPAMLARSGVRARPGRGKLSARPRSGPTRCSLKSAVVGTERGLVELRRAALGLFAAGGRDQAVEQRRRRRLADVGRSDEHRHHRFVEQRIFLRRQQRAHFAVEDRLAGRRPAQSAQCFGVVAIAARGAVGGRGDACPAFQAVAGAHPALLHFIPLGIAHQPTDDHAGSLHPLRVDTWLARCIATRFHHRQVELALNRLEELEHLRPFSGATNAFDQLLFALLPTFLLAGDRQRSGHPPASETQLAAGIAQLVEELAAPIAFAARPGVATRGHTGRTRQTVAQRDAPIGIAQTGQHGLDEVVVAALQDRRRAANGKVARGREDHLVMAHHMFPAPGV
jgi:hypothetical protein